MKHVRRANERGLAEHGWLNSRHTFSFAEYYDPRHVGFRPLRVINEDRVRGGGGFGRHPHRDMEIISYVIRGELAHRDSMGNEAVIKPGEVQRMSAGRGVEHSEYNASATETAHFLQIWIRPSRTGLAPSYAQRSFETEIKGGGLVLVASESGRDDSLTILQDAAVYVARPPEGRTLAFNLRPGRGAWIQMVRGVLSVGDQTLVEGDGFATDEAGSLDLWAGADAEFILFDLP